MVSISRLLCQIAPCFERVRKKRKEDHWLCAVYTLMIPENHHRPESSCQLQDQVRCHRFHQGHLDLTIRTKINRRRWIDMRRQRTQKKQDYVSLVSASWSANSSRQQSKNEWKQKEKHDWIAFQWDNKMMMKCEKVIQLIFVQNTCERIGGGRRSNSSRDWWRLKKHAQERKRRITNESVSQ